jgi:hypothetical protein
MSTAVVSASRSIFEDYEPIHRFTVAEYHRLADNRILDPEESLELLEGYICHKGGRRPSDLRNLGRPEWAGLRRFTVAEYHAMLAAGILKSGDPVELIDGFLVRKMSRNPSHDSAIDLFRLALAPLLPVRCMLRSQQAVTLLDSEPEPDFAVVVGGPRTFTGRHPQPADVLLVAEVADTTLATDRTIKLTAYAKNRLPVYWIVNVADMQVEVYADPQPAVSPPTYATRTDYRSGQVVPLVLDGQQVGTIPVADLLP